MKPWISHAGWRSCLLWLCLSLPLQTWARVPVERASIDASSSAGVNYRPALANDDNIDSRWEADSNNAGTWLMLSFRQATVITGLRIREYGRRMRGYRIQVRGEKDWITVLSGAGGPPENLPLTPILADAVRIVTTAPSEGPPSIREFSAWGTGVSACVPQPGHQTITVVGQLDCAGVTISQPCNALGVAAPLFVLEELARIKNLTLIDGYVSCKGECSMENVHWRNTCPSAIPPSAVIQSHTNDGVPRAVNIFGGTAIGRFGTLFNVNVPHSALNIREFGFSGSAISLNGYTASLSTDLRVFMDDVSIAGALSAGVIRVRAEHGDRATIRNLRIYEYKPGTQPVCVASRYRGDVEIAIGEQWNSFACDVDTKDVAPMSK